MLGWQLCTDVTYPVLLMGKSFPPPGPMIFTLRLQKLDRVLQKYLLEAAYAFVPQVGISGYFLLLNIQVNISSHLLIVIAFVFIH